MVQSCNFLFNRLKPIPFFDVSLLKTTKTSCLKRTQIIPVNTNKGGNLYFFFSPVCL